jgi:hopene-associated glycosyltransferase HpnB
MQFWGFIAGVFCLVVWLALLVARGGFWNVGNFFAPRLPAARIHGLVAVIIPARDESEVIATAVRSLLNQSVADRIHIFVVDDQSTDQTAEVAGETAAKMGRSNAVTVIPGSQLPPGWTGKLWAVEQGIRRADKLNPSFLLLTDADIRHAPGNVATLVAVAEAGNYDLASFMVKLHCRSFAERFLIPPFVFFFFLLYPPNWIRDSQRKTAGAAGGCMLVRPAALKRAGCLESIRGEIIDDCALARAVKGSGGKVWLGVTADTSSERVYGSFGEIEHMIARTAFNQLQHSVLLLLGAMIGLSLTYLVPIALVLTPNHRLAALGVLSWGLMALTYWPMVRFYALHPLWSLMLPFAAGFFMLATVHSAFRFWCGHGGQWKGRSQDGRVATEVSGR